RELLTQALDNDPAERPADAAAFRDALRDARQVLVVDAGGQGGARTLAEALKKAKDGSEIRLRPGHYLECIVLGRSLKLTGDGPRDRIIVESPHGPCLGVRGGEVSVTGLTLRGRGMVNGVPPAVGISRGQLLLSECEVSRGRGIVIEA